MTGVSLAPGLRRISPELIVGGTPTRLLRLSETGAAALDALLEGEAHPAAERLRARLVRVGALLAGVEPGPVDDVTVVIPFAGELSALQRSLAGIPAGVACIVVDDNRSGSLELPGRRVIRTSGGEGPAAARNRGAAQVTTGLIAFLDTDLTLPAGWLAALTGHFTDPGLLAVAPRITSTAGAVRGLTGVLEQRLCALDLGPVPAGVRPDSTVSYLPSTAFLIRRSAFEQLGGFDETMRVGEDVDLTWRLADLGQVRYDPAVVVRHQPREHLMAALRRRADYGTSAGPLEVRHPGRVRHLDLDRWSAGAALATALHPLLGAGVVAAVIASAPRRLPQLPPAVARRLVRDGLGQAVTGVGRYALRPGLPVTVGAMALSRHARRALPLLVVAHAAAARPRFAGVTPREFPARLLLHVADEIAYSIGVWHGAIRHRRPSVLLPFRYARRRD